MRIALTIAGSDSSAGAGIQADLKTFAAHGVFGASAITAITAQNTRGVIAVSPVAADLVTAQIEAVASDFGVHSICAPEPWFLAFNASDIFSSLHPNERGEEAREALLFLAEDVEDSIREGAERALEEIEAAEGDPLDL